MRSIDLGYKTVVGLLAIAMTGICLSVGAAVVKPLRDEWVEEYQLDRSMGNVC